MAIGVSTNYRRLTPEEVPVVAAECDAAWKNPAIPRRQWVNVVRGELQRYREGESMPHFDVLIRALRKTGLTNPSVLEVGASSAYYAAVFEAAGYKCQYSACDYSEAYRELAAELFPEVPFKVCDARNLDYPDNSVAILISGCCIIHVFDAERVISESARVASDFVILNRTPVSSVETTYFQKEAYGCPVFEQHIYEPDLLAMIESNGLKVESYEDQYADPENNYAHRCYLLRRIA